MEENNIHSPIVHSMKKDTVSGAQSVVGSSDVPADEALMLAKMHSSSFKKRQMNVLSFFGIIFIILGVFMFIIPDKFFIKKETGITVEKTKNQNFLGVDSSYDIAMPSVENIQDFKNKSFAGEPGISEIIIKNENGVVDFKNLDPLIQNRFLEVISTTGSKDYLYGFFTNDVSVSYPYFLISVPDQALAESVMQNQERTLYSDFSNILMLPDLLENELLQFESSSSVRIPTRMLQDRSGKVLLLYGFPMENLLLLTTSLESYEAIRSRMLVGY